MEEMDGGKKKKEARWVLGPQTSALDVATPRYEGSTLKARAPSTLSCRQEALSPMMSIANFVSWGPSNIFLEFSAPILLKKWIRQACG
jgi:hypothetical protein